jgi:AmmeMemoRadiSam system protein A
MKKYNEFETQVLQIAALGTWCVVTGQPMIKQLEPVNDPRWDKKSGVFVTLKLGPNVRGSVGMLESSTTLQESLFDAGQSAATHDHRFTPVNPDEIKLLAIEVSVVDETKKITSPAELKVGKNGLIISKGEKRAVMLPQIAFEQGWSSEQFLEATCEKAGLGHQEWKDPNTLVEAFDCLHLESPSLFELVKEFTDNSPQA